MPNANKTANSQIVFSILTQGTEIDAGRTKKGNISGKKYVSLLRAAPNLAPIISTPIRVKRLVKMMTGSMR